MTGDDRINDILKTIKKIQESKQPVNKYCKILQKYGKKGFVIIEKTEITQIIKGYITATVKENRSIASSPLTKPEYQPQKSGGGEIFTFLAFYTNIIDIITKIITRG